MKLDYGKGSNKLDEVVAIFITSSFLGFLTLKKNTLLNFLAIFYQKNVKNVKICKKS